MKRTIWLASLLVSLLVVLTPMAWASPVDPSWIKGISDDGDYDDVVIYLTCNACGIPILPVYHAVLRLVFGLLDPALDGDRIASPSLSPHPPRAPPLG
jgi:hypothetical protein